MKYSLIIAFLISTFACANQDKKPPHSTLSENIDALLKKNQFNGTILITKENQSIYQKAIGFSDLLNRVPLTVNDQFFIGSISKQITAVLILKEIENGRISLDAKIGDYLKQINQPWAREITIHHLLTHTHGIVDLNESLAFKQGTKFQYSQLGYGLLGDVLEAVTNSAFEKIATDFFANIGLKDTFHPANKNYTNLVKGYIEGKGGYLQFAKNSLVEYVPAGGFIATVQDLNQWNQLLYAGKLVSKETLALMQTKYATRQHPIFGEIDYGYGLLFKDGQQNIEVGALGYVQGFPAACYYYPKSKINVLILANTALDLDNFKNTFKVHTEIMSLVRNYKNS